MNIETYFYRVICPVTGPQLLSSPDRWTTEQFREMYIAAWRHLVRRNQYTIRFDHLSEVEQLILILEQLDFSSWLHDSKPAFIQATINHETFLEKNYHIIGGVIV